MKSEEISENSLVSQKVSERATAPAPRTSTRRSARDHPEPDRDYPIQIKRLARAGTRWHGLAGAGWHGLAQVGTGWARCAVGTSYGRCILMNENKA